MSWIERGVIGALAALVLLSIAATLVRVASDPAGRFLTTGSTGDWIAHAEPVTAEIRQWRRMEVPVVRFQTAFDANPAGESIVLSFRSFGEATIWLNGELVFGGPEARQAALDWKREVRRDVTGGIRPGRNRLVVDVRNARGPALLSLGLQGPVMEVSSGPHWTARLGKGPRRPAVLANDTRPHLSAHRGERAMPALAARAGVLAALFVAGATGFLAWHRTGRARPRVRAGVVAGFLVGGAWILLFVVSFQAVPLEAGFDAGSHRDYIRGFAEGSGLPVATDGFSMYHPPLFYALAAIVGGLAESSGLSAGLGWKLIPLASGLGLAALGWVLARSIFPRRPGIQAASAIFSGFLPMNLVVAAYVSNEGLNAFLSAAALVVAVDLLLRERVSIGRLAAFSVFVGLALLTKFTALLVAGVAGAALVLRVAMDGRSAGGGRLSGVAALLLPAVAIAGWFYSRSFVLYGTGIFGNWDFSAPGQVWWAQPGFHTAAYYLDFGSSLVRPFLAGFESFWDSLYSTAWGDGFFAGLGGPGARHATWNYGWMAAVYPLAIPATGLGLVGLLRGAALAVRDPDPCRRAVWALLSVLAAATLFAVFWMTLALPYFGQAKAFYGLFLTPVLGLYGAMGFESVDEFLAKRGGPVAQAILYGWTFVFVCAVFLSFWG